MNYAAKFIPTVLKPLLKTIKREVICMTDMITGNLTFISIAVLVPLLPHNDWETMGPVACPQHDLLTSNICHCLHSTPVLNCWLIGIY